jgi:hypothetical protein
MIVTVNNFTTTAITKKNTWKKLIDVTMIKRGKNNCCAGD